MVYRGCFGLLGFGLLGLVWSTGALVTCQSLVSNACATVLEDEVDDTYTHRYIQTDKQTDKQSDTHRHTEKNLNIEAHMHTNKYAHRHAKHLTYVHYKGGYILKQLEPKLTHHLQLQRASKGVVFVRAP